MKMIPLLLQICLALILPACKKSDPVTPAVPATSFFAKGADVSWLTEMEASGIKFYDAGGTQTDCFLLLKNLGFNTIRLRVWLNPVNGWCNKADLVSKAIRAKLLGMKILINFHYSDSWADPGQQTKPAAWSAFNISGLETAVYNHTIEVMDSLKLNGITPEWVQVGNETNNGLLWPEGKASVNMDYYARLFKAGYNAVKSISPATKVMVHLSNGFDNSLFRWNLDGLKNNGASWDVIGMSLYPTASNWQLLADQCLTNMTDMVNRYGSELMICEVGMSWDQPAACKAFISDIIAKNKSLPGNKGTGVLYWEPQAHNNWKGYTLGAFDNMGKPTIALDAFN